MSEQKFHIGKNGPGPCGARKIACRLGEARHGTEAEVTAIWEKEQEALHGDSMLAGVSRESSAAPTLAPTHIPSSPADEWRASLTKSTLSNKSMYRPSSSDVRYGEAEQAVAMKLALANLSELSYTPVETRDTDWETNGCSNVGRYVLTDGSVGYFKSFGENSGDEDLFTDYGTTSLGASINEVNSYRMGKLLGRGFDELVPETVLREVDGSLGTLQREITEAERKPSKGYSKEPQLRDDYRRAAIFDFVVGNLDRHEENFLYGVDGASDSEAPRIRLIDNSFSFPENPRTCFMNASVFANNEEPGGYADQGGYTIPSEELELRGEEREALARARAGVEEWLSSKTISARRGKATLKRIDFLLKQNRISNFGEYLDDARAAE